MKEKIKKYLPWGIRMFIFIMFMVSAFAKLFPLWMFEKQLVDLGICSWCQASYLARLLIASEIALGIAILQPHFLKRLVIPLTVLMLAAFCVHLIIDMVRHGAMNGNCGCFGQLIPMTPLEALIKNILLIGLLAYLFVKVKDREKGKNKSVYLILIGVASTLATFLFFPFCPCKSESAESEIISMSDTSRQDTYSEDTMVNIAVAGHPDEAAVKQKVSDTTMKVKIEAGPKMLRSQFAGYTSFGNKAIKPDEGKKIFCLFSPGCDHCVEAAAEICEISRSTGFADVYILFMDEETFKIPDFFKEAGCQFPYRVIDIPQFWQLLGSNANTPGVFYLWNGNIMKYYEGNDRNKFDLEDLRRAL